LTPFLAAGVGAGSRFTVPGIRSSADDDEGEDDGDGDPTPLAWHRDGDGEEDEVKLMHDHSALK